MSMSTMNSMIKPDAADLLAEPPVSAARDAVRVFCIVFT